MVVSEPSRVVAIGADLVGLKLYSSPVFVLFPTLHATEIQTRHDLHARVTNRPADNRVLQRYELVELEKVAAVCVELAKERVDLAWGHPVETTADFAE